MNCINCDKLYIPFWESDIIYEEVVTFIKKGNEPPKAQLLYDTKEIISIKSYTLEKTYDKNDYSYSGNILTAYGCELPFLTEELLEGVGAEKIGASRHEAKEKGKYIIFTESPAIVMHQLKVTYRKKASDIFFSEEKFDCLKNTREILESKKPLKLFIYGDSIMTGASSSQKLGIRPFQKRLGDAFAQQLQKKFEIELDYKNGSVGGYKCTQGLENIAVNMGDFVPDLVILGFGMNCGSFMLSPKVYKINIEKMMEYIRQKNTNAEFILIATMLPNPLSPQNTIQKSFLGVLKDIAKKDKGACVLDMTSFTEKLYQRKPAIDFLVNNINHPNDFLSRCYVMKMIKGFD